MSNFRLLKEFNELCIGLIGEPHKWKDWKLYSRGEIKGIKIILPLKGETQNSFKIILQDSFKK